MESYIELRNRQQSEFNALPIGYAFSEQQFDEMMSGWGLSGDDKDSIVSLTGGGFIQKKDLQLYHDTMNRMGHELESAISEDTTGNGFVYQMFLTELRNHEFSYTGDPEDALDALGYTIGEVYADKKLLHGYEKAVRVALADE